MKPPNPKACAEALELFDRDPMDAYIDRGDIIRDALRFCAREPDGYALRTLHNDATITSKKSLGSRPYGSVEYACYRLEESDDDTR